VIASVRPDPAVGASSAKFGMHLILVDFLLLHFGNRRFCRIEHFCAFLVISPLPIGHYTDNGLDVADFGQRISLQEQQVSSRANPNDSSVLETWYHLCRRNGRALQGFVRSQSGIYE
jgi:hypothetical protein